MRTDPHTPCIVGVARRTWHPGEVGEEGAPEPLAMWEEMARRAAADSGSTRALEDLGALKVVYCQSWTYDDAPARLAERLSVAPRQMMYSGIGGSVPLTLLAESAEQIAAGSLDTSLVVGGEALATLRRYKKAGGKPDWSYKPAEKRPFPFPFPFHPSEIAHQVFEAYLTFALFDNARRAHLGRSLPDHSAAIGALLSPMSYVAAENPTNAWFPIKRSPEEIAIPTADNRMVAYPYTKLATAIMDVDMASAVLIASEAKADSLGVPRDRRVYLRGWGYAEDPPYVAQRRDLWRSAGMAAASKAALDASSVGVDDLAYFDLYSCFASSVAFALDALGLREESFSDTTSGKDLRSVTLTGGLPYHGGPGSDYMTHSITAMVEGLREKPGSYGMVSGVGMHMMKHAFGVLSTDPGPFRSCDRQTIARAMETEDVVEIADPDEALASVATYSVLHGRNGEPDSALLVCDLRGGARCYARMAEPEALAAAENQELVGTRVRLMPADGGVNLATFP